MRDWGGLDTAILTRIRGGFTRYYEIWPACGSVVPAGLDVCRAVDRRLQALKKQGKISCFGQRWHVLDVQSKGEERG